MAEAKSEVKGFSKEEQEMMIIALSTHVSSMKRAGNKPGIEDELRGYYARKEREFNNLLNKITSGTLF